MKDDALMGSLDLVMETPFTEEIATRSRTWDYMGMLRYLPNPDHVLKKTGKQIDVYKEIITDPRVRGAINNRKAGSLNTAWYLDHTSVDPMVSAFLDRIFGNIDVERLIHEILNAVAFGYQPLEIMWKMWGPYYDVESIRAKPVNWFNFSPENELQFITRDDPFGEPLPPNRFLVAQHNPEYDNPYGEAVLSSCYWPVVFKRGGLKFWVRFTEKYGMPWVKGTHQPNAGKAKILDFLSDLRAMVQDSAFVGSPDQKIELMQANSTMAADGYEKFLGYLNAEINIAILGHTASGDATPGKLGNDENVSEVRSDLIGADKNLVKKVVNEFIDTIVNLNFGPSIHRSRFKLMEEQDVKQHVADRDFVLAKLGVRYTKAYFTTVYGIKPEHFDVVEPIISAGKIPLFSEEEPDQVFAEKRLPAGQQAIDELGDSLTPEQLQYQASKMLAPILDLVAKSSDFNEVMDQLVKLYPDMNTKALESVLAPAIALSKATGRLAANAEAH